MVKYFSPWRQSCKYAMQSLTAVGSGQQWWFRNWECSQSFFFGKSINQLINQSTRRKFENFFSWIRQFHFKRTRLLPSCPSPPPSRPKTRPDSATTARGGTTRPCNSAASARCTDRRCYTLTRRWSATPSGVNVANLFFPLSLTKRPNKLHCLQQGILKGEVSLYHWPPVWLVWNQLYEYWQFLFLFAKQTNPNQSNRRSMVLWYFPF